MDASIGNGRLLPLAPEEANTELVVNAARKEGVEPAAIQVPVSANGEGTSRKTWGSELGSDPAPGLLFLPPIQQSVLSWDGDDRDLLESAGDSLHPIVCDEVVGIAKGHMLEARGDDTLVLGMRTAAECRRVNVPHAGVPPSKVLHMASGLVCAAVVGDNDLELARLSQQCLELSLQRIPGIEGWDDD
jgi:hypothetical protein